MKCKVKCKSEWNAVGPSQPFALHKRWSDDSDFSEKSEAMCQFFDKRGYPISVVKAGHHPAQQIDRQSALQTAETENTDRTPFTLHFTLTTPRLNLSFLENFKLLQNDSETGTIFSQPPLISFKRDKNIGNFLVRSSFQTNDQSGTFNCARSQCKACPFIHNLEKISGPKRSIKITVINLRVPPPVSFTA